MKRVSSKFAVPLALVAFAGGCSDSPLPTEPVVAPTSAVALEPALSESRRRDAGSLFRRYVAIGTSITMGVQSDGVFKDSQKHSWAAQLSRLAGHEMTLPLIKSPGCGAPLFGALATGKRLSGESAGRPFATGMCADNEAGVTLPTANVAVDGAWTRDALYSTTTTYAGLRGLQYTRVLPEGKSQVQATLDRDPEFVSIELGGNDIIGARSGVHIPGVTVARIEDWRRDYAQVVRTVRSKGRRGILVGLTGDALHFPGFRTGLELWNARETFKPFNVAVAEDCSGVNSGNVLFVPVVVPTAVARGAANAGKGPYTLSCQNQLSSSGIQDFVLSPEEIQTLNVQLKQMNAFIRWQAVVHRFAHVELEVIYGRSDAKPAFDAWKLMTTPQPYGPYVSLDGIHPSTEGSRILAEAAAAALNRRYGLRIGQPTIADDDGDADEEDDRN